MTSALLVYDVRSGLVVGQVPWSFEIDHIDWSPDSSQIVFTTSEYNKIVIYDVALSDSDRNALFGYLAGKYGIDIGAGAPSLTVVWSGNNIMISWPGSAGGFLLESSDVLPAVNWTNVPFNPPPPGQNASVTVTPAGKSQYYRLRHP